MPSDLGCKYIGGGVVSRISKLAHFLQEILGPAEKFNQSKFTPPICICNPANCSLRSAILAPCPKPGPGAPASSPRQTQSRDTQVCSGTRKFAHWEPSPCVSAARTRLRDKPAVVSETNPHLRDTRASPRQTRCRLRDNRVSQRQSETRVRLRDKARPRPRPVSPSQGAPPIPHT